MYGGTLDYFSNLFDKMDSSKSYIYYLIIFNMFCLKVSLSAVVY